MKCWRCLSSGAAATATSLVLILLHHISVSVDGFSISSPPSASLPQHHIYNHRAPTPTETHRHHQWASRTVCRVASESPAVNEVDLNDKPKILMAYAIAAISTIGAWVQCSLTALKSHPDPALEAICGLRHNVLTMGQAFCLPLPLVASVFVYLVTAIKNDQIEEVTSRRLNLGLGVCSVWLGSAAMFTPVFSCGYNLYPKSVQCAAAAAHYFTSVLCFAMWSSSVSSLYSKAVGTKISRLVNGITGSIWSLGPKKCSDNPDTKEGSDGRNEYAICAALFGYFGIMPLIAPFPLATIPVILGRRLSRAASAWTLLAAVVSYSLKDAIERGESVKNSSYTVLVRGLAIGSFLHIVLVALKLIGVDGGGLLLPGGGLWKVYPMMLKAPFAGIVAILTYCLAIFAGMTAN